MEVRISYKAEEAFVDEGKVLLPGGSIELIGLPENLPYGWTKNGMEEWLTWNMHALLAVVLGDDITYCNEVGIEVEHYLLKLNALYRTKVLEAAGHISEDDMIGVMYGKDQENDTPCDDEEDNGW